MFSRDGPLGVNGPYDLPSHAGPGMIGASVLKPIWPIFMYVGIPETGWLAPRTRDVIEPSEGRFEPCL